MASAFILCVVYRRSDRREGCSDEKLRNMHHKPENVDRLDRRRIGHGQSDAATFEPVWNRRNRVEIDCGVVEGC
jgi:hypothetical protein